MTFPMFQVFKQWLYIAFIIRKKQTPVNKNSINYKEEKREFYSSQTEDYNL